MYLELFTILTEKIKRSKNVSVHSSFIYPPLEKKVLEALLEQLPIHDDLAEFYAEMNGFQLSYTFRNNPDFDKEAFGYYDQAFPKMWTNENYWHLDGCINILPVDFILGNNWKDYIWFEPSKGINPKLEFEKQLLPFDVFSKDSITVFHPMENAIYLATDHNASYYDFKPTTPSEYLRGILDTRGLVEKRSSLFVKP